MSSAPVHAFQPSTEHQSPNFNHRVIRRHGIGFWLIAFTFVSAMAFSTVATPLYSLYRQRDGFSTFTVTVVFAVYAVGVLVSLLLAGHISDWFGRKKILLIALGFEIVAAVLFLADPTLPVLLTARVLTGFGVGMLTATATAHLSELHAVNRPGASQQRFEIVSTAANIGGLGLGPLVAGLLAQFVVAPLRMPYAIFAMILILNAVAVLASPETVEPPATRPVYRPQRLSVDHGDPAGYVAAGAAGFAAFAIFGFFTSVAPGFVSGVLHHSSLALAGLVVFAVFGGAALAQSLTGSVGAATRRDIGLVGQAVGVVVLVWGMYTSDFVAFLIGGIAAGAGAGVLFKSSVGAVVGMARLEKRGEALAGLFLLSYLGLAVPALGIGIATLYTSATAAVTWLAAGLVVLLLAVRVLAGRSARS